MKKYLLALSITLSLFSCFPAYAKITATIDEGISTNENLSCGTTNSTITADAKEQDNSNRSNSSNSSNSSNKTDKSIRKFYLPGHDKGNKDLVCQGIAYVPGEKLTNKDPRYILLSYYPNTAVSKACAQLVLIDRTKGKRKKHVKRFSLYNKDKTPYTLHAGGIAVAHDYLWVSSNFKLWGFALSDIMNSSDAKVTNESGLPDSLKKLPAKKIYVKKTYGVDSKSSYVSFDKKSNMLWVGDYAKESDNNADNQYEPIEHHKKISKDSLGWVAGYEVNENGVPKASDTYNFKYRGKTIKNAHKPDMVIGVPNNVQGAAICDNHIALSVSCGPTKSKLIIHSNPLINSQTTTFKYTPNGCSKEYQTNGCILNDKNHVKTIIKPLPAGTEDLEYDGKYVYMTFESNAGKYIENVEKKNKERKAQNKKPIKIKKGKKFYLLDLSKNLK